jgi:hypothetical protein
MPKNTMAWSYRKNAIFPFPPKKKMYGKLYATRRRERPKMMMAGLCVHEPEKDENKRKERQSKGLRGLEAYCKGGQGPPRAVVPPKKNVKSAKLRSDYRTTFSSSLSGYIIILKSFVEIST